MERDLVSESTLVTPHGGTLVDRLVPAADAAAFAAHAATLAPLPLDAREQADLELIAIGAASPLTGFLGKADYDSVLGRTAPGGRHGVAAAVHAGGRRRCAGCRRRGARARRRRRSHLGHDPGDRDLHARSERGVARRLRHRRPGASRRRVSPRSPDAARRRPGEGASARRRPAVRRVPLHAAPAPRAHRRPRLEARRRLPDAQPDSSRARAPHQARARGQRRPRHSPARRRDQAGRRAGGGAVQGVRGARREVLPEGPHRAGGVSGGDALRGAARGDLPRHRAQELRHQPADRRPRSRRRRQVLRAAGGAADLRSVRAERPRRHAAPAGSDVLLPRLRHARLVEELPARRELAARALGIEGARDPASRWPSARGVHAARSGGGAARSLYRGQRRASC